MTRGALHGLIVTNQRKIFKVEIKGLFGSCIRGNAGFRCHRWTRLQKNKHREPVWDSHAETVLTVDKTGFQFLCAADVPFLLSLSGI